MCYKSCISIIFKILNKFIFFFILYRYLWERTNSLIAESMSKVVWDIPEDTKPGRYRIRHFGNSKNILQVIKPYVGTSGEFDVVPNSWYDNHLCVTWNTRTFICGCGVSRKFNQYHKFYGWRIKLVVSAVGTFPKLNCK